MAITLDRRPKGRYPCGIFHTSLGSTLCIESELKSDGPVDGLPLLVQAGQDNDLKSENFKESYVSDFL